MLTDPAGPDAAAHQRPRAELPRPRPNSAFRNRDAGHCASASVERDTSGNLPPGLCTPKYLDMNT
eukprot:3332186-Amphidinium_carterae.1